MIRGLGERSRRGVCWLDAYFWPNLSLTGHSRREIRANRESPDTVSHHISRPASSWVVSRLPVSGRSTEKYRVSDTLRFAWSLICSDWWGSEWNEEATFRENGQSGRWLHWKVRSNALKHEHLYVQKWIQQVVIQLIKGVVLSKTEPFILPISLYLISQQNDSASRSNFELCRSREYVKLG